MTEALKQGKPVRGLTSIAARPDGRRVHFAPLPTPFFDARGQLLGAINALIYVTDRPEATDLQQQAQRCYRLADSISDARTISGLKDMAVEYEAKANAASAFLKAMPKGKH